MKILFIYYETPDEPISFPLGVGLLSSILKKKGHRVKGLYIRTNLNNPGELAKISDRVKKFSPKLICYSSTSPAFEHIKKMAQYLRKYFKILSICGGAHPTLYPEDSLSAEGIDYICVGEGEKALAEFVEKMEKEEDCSKVPGIWTSNSKNGVIKNELYPLNQELDELPWFDYEVFGKSFIKKDTKNGWLRYITSRGCPYNCAYCHNKLIRETYSKGIGISINKLRYIRFRSSDSCIEEINYLHKKYNLKVINFMDDLFCLKKDKTIEFCKKFRERLPTEVGFSIQTHLEHMDRDLVDILRDSRCLRVVVGVESGSQRILDLFKRKTEPKKMSEKLRLLVNAKFPLGVWTLNILGSPTETKEEMMGTLAINARCTVNRVKFNIMSPYPGTEIYDFCKNNNLFKRNPEEQHFEDRYSTKLKFPQKEREFLEKFFDIGHWYMNLYIPGDIGNYYKLLIKDVEKIGPDKWERDKSRYKEIDRKLSKRLCREGKQHYNFIYQGKVIGKVIGLQINNEIS